MSKLCPHDSKRVKLKDSLRLANKARQKATRVWLYCPACAFSTLNEPEYKAHYRAKHLRGHARDSARGFYGY